MENHVKDLVTFVMNGRYHCDAEAKRNWFAPRDNIKGGQRWQSNIVESRPKVVPYHFGVPWSCPIGACTKLTAEEARSWRNCGLHLQRQRERKQERVGRREWELRWGSERMSKEGRHNSGPCWRKMLGKMGGKNATQRERGWERKGRWWLGHVA